MTSNSQLFDVMSGYLEPWRQHHNVDHPVKIMRTMMMLRNSNHLPKWMTEFAWYHDAVYAPGAEDNEKLSADLYLAHKGITDVTELSGAAMSTKLAYTAIMNTSDPLNCRDSDSPSMLICRDADLSVLGLPADQYLEYTCATELETVNYLTLFADGDNRKRTRAIALLFLQGRLRFVGELLDYLEEGNVLYKTSIARTLWEENVRKNLAAEDLFLRKRIKRIS